MKVAGIICEYNPIHNGHVWHIEKTRQWLGPNSAIVCLMSGNFVQRGDVAVFGKHARAEMAVRCGADLVVELPSPYALSSAEGFARAGVFILDRLGVCDAISFGSESGDINALREAAEAIATAEADVLIRECLGRGLPYAAACQKAADAVLGPRSEVFRSPNNLLGIEYVKAITALGSQLKAVTIRREGGEHDGGTGLSSSAIRKMLLDCVGQGAAYSMALGSMPDAAAAICMEEISAGRGPVFMKNAEAAMLSRLRAIKDYSGLPDATEGLDKRFARYAASEPTVAAVLEKTKTKRYAMSRLRRMLMCACLGITAEDTREPPPYIRVLAMNAAGREMLNSARKKAALPIITKPASVRRLPGRAVELFKKEAAATDFYALSYPGEAARAGGDEWRMTPVVIM